MTSQATQYLALGVDQKCVDKRDVPSMSRRSALITLIANLPESNSKLLDQRRINVLRVAE